jgi:hypothetical protein
MFVRVVQLLKNPKRAEATPIPSLIRLQPLDSSLKGSGEGSDAGRLETKGAICGALPVASSWFVDADWETTFTADNIGIAAGGQEEQLTDQAVQRGSKVVDDLADHDAENEGRIRPSFNPKSMEIGLRIELGGDNSIGMFFEEPLRSSMERVDLALCPVDSFPQPIEGMHDAYSDHEC